MKNIILLTIVLPFLFSCQQPAMKTVIVDPYIAGIDSLRKVKDQEMKNSADSPIPADQRMNFAGLVYFPIDTAYRVEASLIQFEEMDTFEMATTTDRAPKYLRFGMVNFKIGGRGYLLEVYKNLESLSEPGHERDLFIPFKDFTNEKETYGGGRYLDLQADGPQIIMLDFNLAYNPYCAYNHKYSCPIPPDFNNLKTEIRAGEKNPTQ